MSIFYQDLYTHRILLVYAKTTLLGYYYDTTALLLLRYDYGTLLLLRGYYKSITGRIRHVFDDDYTTTDYRTTMPRLQDDLVTTTLLRYYYAMRAAN